MSNEKKYNDDEPGKEPDDNGNPPESQAIDYDIPGEETSMPEPPTQEEGEEEDIDDFEGFVSKRAPAIDPNRKKRKKKKNHKAPIIVAGSIAVLCIAASSVIFGVKYTEGEKESDKIPADLLEVASQVDKQVDKADSPANVSGANCFIGEGITDFGSSEQLINLFGGSSMAEGKFIFQVKYDGDKANDVHTMKVTPETCLTIYPLDDRGEPDQQKGDAIDNGYYIFGAREDSNNSTESLMVYSSEEDKVLDKTYNILDNKFN